LEEALSKNCKLSRDGSVGHLLIRSKPVAGDVPLVFDNLDVLGATRYMPTYLPQATITSFTTSLSPDSRWDAWDEVSPEE